MQTLDPTKETYESPLISRYSSREMSKLFSPQFKHSTWRKLWVALAEAEMELGLPINEQQIEELREHIHDIDFEQVKEYEARFHHDVMAHIHAYGDLCPNARGIIHLGATSCYVTDNTDLIQMNEGLTLLKQKLLKVISRLKSFSLEHAGLTTLAYTHFQPAQPTTVGKRAALWAQDFITDLEELTYRQSKIKLLGVKGTTGTQASFLSLFNGNHDKVHELDRIVTNKLGFTETYPISGQTYSRKQDALILAVLAQIAISSHKFSTDLRLLSHLREVEEAPAKDQIGSSAMPHKHNPIYSERICSLARFLLSLTENPAYTASFQWFERTLDDSANRRLSIAEAFLTCDAILEILLKINLKVYPKVIQKHLEEELPFMATETILMEAVAKGADRQKVHEKIRQHCREAGLRIKEEGKANNLSEQIANDSEIPLDAQEIAEILSSTNFSGCAERQVHDYFKKSLGKI